MRDMLRVQDFDESCGTRDVAPRRTVGVSPARRNGLSQVLHVRAEGHHEHRAASPPQRLPQYCRQRAITIGYVGPRVLEGQHHLPFVFMLPS